MNFTFTRHVGDGVTTALSFSFAGQDLGYLTPTNIVVTVDGVPAPFSINIADPNKVYMLTPPRSGSDVIIRRIMPNKTPFSDFRGGNAFKAETLNNTNLQQLYLLQELLDGFLPDGFYVKQDIDLGGHKITNSGDAVDKTDLVTKGIVDEINERLIRIEASLGDVGNDTIPWAYVARTEVDTINPPYNFRAALVFINGITQTLGDSYIVSDNTILLAEKLEVGDKVFVLIGKYIAPSNIDTDVDPDTRYLRIDNNLSELVAAGGLSETLINLKIGTSDGASVVLTSTGESVQQHLTTLEETISDMAHKSGEKFTGAISARGITSKTTYGNLIVGDVPVTLADSLRDAINVSRKIDNSLTNCHGFSDKTWINQASDYGGYGSFDSTVLVSGSNTHNHAYSFQDRINYSGSGTLENMQGLYSSPSITGSGTVIDRKGIFINNATITGSGKLLQQNGIFIEDLFSAGTNVGIHVRQTSGFGYYSPNFGKMYQNGVAGFGVEPSQLSTAINWRSGADAGFYGFVTTDNNGVSLGATQDTKLQFVSGGEVRLQIKRGTGFNRAVTAGNDNLTPLGDSTNRWSVIYAGTGAINTSDGREKSEPISIDTLSDSIAIDGDKLLDAWGDVSIIAFRWLSSIEKKGDNARWHFGVIAQQIRDAFQNHGIDGTRLGLLCYNEWEDIVDEQSGDIIKLAGNLWGVRPDQCAWIEAAYQRRINESLIKRIERLEMLLSK